MSEPGVWGPLLDRLEGMGRSAIAMLPGLVAGLLLFALFALLGRAARRGVRRFYARSGHVRHRSIGLVMGRLAQGALVTLGALVAAAAAFPDFTPGDLVSALGIGSVAIGFAFRDVLQNYLAGILLLLTEPFRIDDQIVFGAYEGTVEDIQTRATFLKTYDGRRVVIPNAELFTNSVTVNTAFERRRLEFDFGVGFGDDIEEARQIALQVLRELEEALDDPPPEVLTWDLGESAVILRARWWIQPPRIKDALDARDRVVAAIKTRLQEAGIDLPFPTRQVLFHDQTEETDGDRRRQREGWPAGPGEVPKPARSA